MVLRGSAQDQPTDIISTSTWYLLYGRHQPKNVKTRQARKNDPTTRSQKSVTKIRVVKRVLSRVHAREKNKCKRVTQS
jgi:hypothetical protein